MKNQPYRKVISDRTSHILFCLSIGLIMGILIFIISCFLHPAHAATLYTYGGRAVSNSVTDVHSNAWSVEQETRKWDLGYVNEGHQRGDKRDGIYALRVFNYQFAQRVTTQFGIGPYFTATTETEPNGINYQDHYSWAALSAASIEYQATLHWSFKARWAHVLYATHNRDTDIFLLGVGYSPESW